MKKLYCCLLVAILFYANAFSQLSAVATWINRDTIPVKIGIYEDNIYYTYYRDLDADGFGNAERPEQISSPTPPPGYVINKLDCNDGDNTVFPGGQELCDKKDNNCNGLVDDTLVVVYYFDWDSDGFGNSDIPPLKWASTCPVPSSFVVKGGDCYDDPIYPPARKIYPGATELCDGFDNDCNGLVDDTVAVVYYFDWDGDGFGNSDIPPLKWASTCPVPSSFVAKGGDCNDDPIYAPSRKIYPGATELCDGIDNDCDGQVDEGCPALITINDVTVYESQGLANLSVSLSMTSSKSIQVKFKTVNGTATSPKDFRQKSGTLKIPAGSKSGTISVKIYTDNKEEPEEYFNIQLSRPVNAQISDETGSVTILDGTAPNTTAAVAVNKFDEINNSKQDVVLQQLSVQALPNPTHNYFTLIFRSRSNTRITVKIMDVLGRVVETRSGIMANSSVMLGNSYRPGFYCAHVTQENETVVVKMIKK